TANGLTASYSTNFFTSNANGGPNPDFTAVDGGFSDGGPPFGVGGISVSGFKNFTWYPTSVVTSSWFILPLSNRSTMAPASGGGIRWAGRAISDHLPAPNIQGAYDLDERFFSGGNVVRVRCFGVLTRASFLNGPSDISTAGGGHTFMTGSGTPVLIAPATDTHEAEAGTFGGQPFTALKCQSTTALGGLRSAVHQEPDHTPCFNPTGAFPTPFGTSTLGFSCAGY